MEAFIVKRRDPLTSTASIVVAAECCTHNILREKNVVSCQRSLNNKKSLGLILLAGAIMLVLMVGFLPRPRATPNDVVALQCPKTVKKAENYDNTLLETYYLTEKAGEANTVLARNITEFLETFRTSKFDSWGTTYQELKEGFYPWKSRMFAENLNDGDSIYESACGIGLNLYMTLEVLNEVKGFQSLVIYGNDYLAESAKKANLLFDRGAPFSTRKGAICHGDSSDLYFVPSDSFDLVYTGFLPPLSDPLELSDNDGEAYNGGNVYVDLCKATDWKSKKLASLAQKRQNDFTGRVVGEMVRIAKPGKAIIVEQISLPKCDDYADWGGVSREWWTTCAIDDYGWDVDPESITIEDDPVLGRYNVFMRKN